MIKAETITHEGVPGPNWLEHCRAVFTPSVMTTLVVVAAALALGSVLYHRQSAHNTTPTYTSQQSGYSDTSTLRVQPLNSTDSSPQSASTLANTANQTAAAGSSKAGSSSTSSTSNQRGSAASAASLAPSDSGAAATSPAISPQTPAATAPSALQGATTLVNNDTKPVTAPLQSVINHL